MVKRQKWTEREDAELRRLIAEDGDEPRWDTLAVHMSEQGFNKSAKQCRER